MAVIENSKITVVGAGSVGSSVAYAALIRGAARTVALYDINAPRAEAEVLDLAHGTMFTGSSSIIGGADLSAVEGSHVVIVTAGAKQNPGQTRLELIGTNARIFDTMIPQLVEAAPNAVFVIVTNPCDVLTMRAVRRTGLAPERLFASGTVLDTSRLRWLLAARTGVAARSIHAHIVGEHGDTEFALWSSATIGPVALQDWRRPGHEPITRAHMQELTDDVRNAAYRVIEGKGATNYAIGLSAVRIAEAVLRDENAVLPVSTVLDDFHGISGVALSVPSIVNASGAFPVRETPFDAEELELLRSSAEALREVDASLPE
ncbi:L-lactate dehydrogenase [Brevibacterium samyangense]|uniref:L-lactate dehydrogenase n=1 Tax=Brevibacterium samyangense TaxID=366888 RepID=A0ABN2T384_9MICO